MAMPMDQERAAMTTIDEVYFLVRVGSWTEDDLENYIQERADAQGSKEWDQGYEKGYDLGLEEGREAMSRARKE